MAAFAAFDEAMVVFAPDGGQRVSVNPGVSRAFCPACGSPLAGRYDYLPGQVFIPLGILDQANQFVPQMHAHEAERLTWLHINDDLERVAETARSTLVDPDG